MRRLLLIISFSLLTLPVLSQISDDIRFFARGVSVEEAILKLSRQTGINIAYDSSIEMDQTVFVNITSTGIAEVLKEILRDTGLDFVILSTGTYVITRSSTRSAPRSDLRGYVRDASTGEPLANATIMIADAGGSAISNNNGYFSFGSMLTGSYDVVASYVGYKPRKTEIRLSSNGSPVHVIELQPESYLIEPLTVTEEAYPFAYGAFSDDIRPGQQEETISPYANSIRTMSAVPGVNFNWAKEQISIQGGSGNDHLLRLDGVPVYNNSVAGGTFGMFSSYAIDRISVSKSVFPASEGSAISGVVDFSHDISSSKKQELMLQLDPYALNARLSGAVPGRESIQLMASFRGSIWDQFREPQLNGAVNDWNRLDPLLQNFLMGSADDIASYSPVDGTNELRYSDIHFAGNIDHNAYNTTSFSAYFGFSSTGADLLSRRTDLISQQPDYVFASDITDQSNQMMQISHYAVLGSRTDAEIQAYFTSSSFSNQYAMLSHEQNGTSQTNEMIWSALRTEARNTAAATNENRIREWGLKSEVQYYMQDGLKLRAGIEPRLIDYRFHLADLFYFPTVTDEQTLLIGSFTELARNTGGARYTLGLRATHHNGLKKVFFEPRFKVSLKTNSDPDKEQRLSFSAGIYNQYVNQFGLTNPGPNSLSPVYRVWEPNDETTTVPRSFNFGVDWQVPLSRRLSLRAESYFRIMDRGWALNYGQILSVAGPGNELQEQSSYFETMSGRNFGGSLSITYADPESSLFMTLTQESNFAYQKFGERFGSRYQQSPFSEPYTINGYLRLPLAQSSSISFNGRWTPLRYWAYNNAYYNFVGIHENTFFSELDLDNPGRDRLSYYLRLDMAVHQKVKLGSSQIDLRLDLINLLNRQNEIFRFLNPRTVAGSENMRYQTLFRELPGFTPLLSLKFSI